MPKMAQQKRHDRRWSPHLWSPFTMFEDELDCFSKDDVCDFRSARRVSRRRLKRPPTPTPDELRARAAEIEANQAATAAREMQERKYWLDHKASLLDLGRNMPDASGRSTFTHAGCVAALLGVIAEGGRSREEILSTMRGYRYSYRHAGFLLAKLTGTDPERHLWAKTSDGSYGLLGSAPAIS